MFTIIAKIISRKPHVQLSDELSKEFWHKVAFYNSIQFSVGKTARIRPKEGMWKESLNPLKIVLTDLKPDIIVVLGKELANYVSTFDNSSSPIFCYWNHPSSPKYFKKASAISTFEQSLEMWMSESN